ncbi:MAG: Apolipoprotein N-acyltransferase, partial [Pseudomonadota bacterium]
MTMWTFGASLLAGVLHGFSMAWPAFALGDALSISGQAFGALQVLSLAGLGALLLQAASQESEFTNFTHTRRPGRTGRKAWVKGFNMAGLFATAAMTSTWGWLYVSMHQYGGLPSWLACLAVVLLAMALASYFAMAGGL